MLPPAALAAIDRAGRLTRDEVVRLDLAERRRADILPTVWDLLRDRFREPAVREQRMEARNAAWAAVASSLIALGIEPVEDDGYWRVVQRVGAGAQRAARYAACALVAPELLDEDCLEILLDPWLSAIRD
ncbi:MAG: hypothetical protein ACYDAN_10230 [Candidatus Limnocylindrales bacterium]